MINLGLTGAEQKLYDEALVTSGVTDVRVSVLDANEEHMHEFGGNIISGQIDYAIDEPRQLSLVVDGLVPFEPDSPSESAMYAHRFIRVQYGVRVRGMEQFVWVPVFWGPVTEVATTTNTTTITAQGKEILLQEPHIMWRTFTRKKGVKYTDCLKDLLRERGETRLDIPDIDRKLPKPFSVTPDQAPWEQAQRIARTLNRQLFYDGRGFAVLRARPEQPRWTWKNPLTQPEFTYNVTDARNSVKVYGPETHGKYPRIKAVAVLAPSHPLSPVALARNGVPRYMTEILGVNAPTPPTKPDEKASKEDKAKYARQYDKWAEHYHSREKHALELAETTLRQKAAAILEVAFDALPVPDIEEGDPFGVNAGDQFAHARFTSGTLPLRVSDSSGMSIGYHRRVSWKSKILSRSEGV